ncbi:hypothetical protein GCM10007859_04330 [Brevundimonas denitrificans]|uniref:Uncharacterized protein n=1 Tax=Brevundimonas denitrificans TaxID=1443434 RepID=A0ABQ6BJN5_9CAUL|nr:hypothetical protein [Brevundimonas denitrificans]GLS00427.1 hypothetical protein GCM10007859_04330 [Brevundimonas denitrificans]
MIDLVASDRVRRYGLPESLRVPIAAIDELAIERHVGVISETLSGAGTRRAFLVRAHPPLPADPRLPIWEQPGADMLHQPLQVWVHRTYGRYRRAYQRAFPDTELDGLVLSHAMNRRLAAAKGFDFVRLTPTSRAANSSSAFAEGWAIDRHSVDEQIERNRKLGLSVQYADLTDLMLILDIRLGGGVMDAVNEGQKLIRPRA